MEREDADRPDNVIALSRYRAQLSRGRKLRRADALLSGPDPERAIRALPGDELYYLIHETGLRDAGDILVHARPEQVQVALDFALWDRDQIVPDRLAEWLETMAEAPSDRIGAWLAGLDVELVALLIRKAGRIYDLTQEEPPDEPAGITFATPDGFFLIDAVGIEGSGDLALSARVVVRLLDALYRTDKDLARRILVGARAELDAELEELAYRWREGRMADLGFHDFYEALEVYRELEPASVHVGEAESARGRVQPIDVGDRTDPPARIPVALVDRLAAGATPFARAVQALTSPDEIAELHYALVALTNRVLAADRVAPGDDATVTATLERMAATLDLAIEFLGRGDAEVARDALRTVPLMRLFRVGVSLAGKVRRLALTLRRQGPFGAGGRDLAEPEDADVLAALTRVRPLYPAVLDEPRGIGERPFRSLADLARATAAVERAAAAQAMLAGLGLRPQDLAAAAAGAPPSLLEAAGVDAAAIDAGVLARTALVRRLLDGRMTGRAKGRSSPAGEPSIPFEPLEPREVRDFEALLDVTAEGKMKLPDTLKKKAKAILDAASPGRLAGAAAAVADRWIGSLAPLEPVLVRKPQPQRPPRRK